MPSNILVAEDDVIVAHDLRETLTGLGYPVSRVVHRGDDAVKAAEGNSVDLAILDVRMPGDMDGIDAGRRLNAMGIPVIYVSAMALVHELLYAPEDLDSFELDDYLHRLAALLRAQFDGHGARIEVDAELDGTGTPLDAAVLCGLLVTELVSNALEHAFPDGKGGTVRVSARRLGPHGLALTVEDDGRGFAEGFDPRQGESLGWKLVESLTSQLGGTLDVRPRPGLRVTVRAEEALRRGQAP